MANQYDILFEPVQIGPVTAPNRFYQVPHCNGLGHLYPKALAEMRGIKAQGGWGTVCTEEVEIHHSSEVTPFVEGRLWDDNDIPAVRMMTDKVHEHGSLAGIELGYFGLDGGNIYSRVPALTPTSQMILGASAIEPTQSRALDKQDLKDIRKWHRNAAIRAKKAGFDIVYVYASHNMTLAYQMLLKRYNQRTDEYGGSLENRARFLKELLIDTKEAIGDTCAVALRFSVDERSGSAGMEWQKEGREVVEMFAEIPDLWDVNIANWPQDSSSSRFEKEGFQEPYVNFVKPVTTKPVVGVGMYTSPETMVSLVKNGVLDLIGAARPSIADPYLPNKIREGRIEDIRECIGCNICVIGDTMRIPIRCTQNPTMGEEYKRDWHPEQIAPKKSDSDILVVGAGPAGLECAMQLGKRGYKVSLCEARRELGGRVALESKLPGLIEWARVADYRTTQIEKLDNVTVYPGNPMSAKDVLEVGTENVIIATGYKWRRDGIGRDQEEPIPGFDQKHVYCPDDIMEENLPAGKVVVYDTEHYYMGGLIAEKLKEAGCDVTIVTNASLVSAWMTYTLEQDKVQHKLMEMGVNLMENHSLTEIESDSVWVEHNHTEEEQELECDAVVLVTSKIPNDELYQELKPELDEGKLKTLLVIGDAKAPNIIERAIFAGHHAAREFDENTNIDVTPFKRERMVNLPEDL